MMTDSREARSREMSTGLARQRRNLIAVCCISPLFVLGEITVEKVNLLGTILRVENPAIVKYILLAVFLYCLIRYMQYYSEELWAKESHQKFWKFLYGKEHKAITRKARRAMDCDASAHSSVVFANRRYSPNMYLSALPNTPNRLLFPWWVVVRLAAVPQPVQSDSESRSNLKEEFISRMDGQNGWTRLEHENDSTNPIYIRDFYLSVLSVIRSRIMGMLRYVFAGTDFTDYQLPIVFSVGAITIFIVGHATT